MSGYHHHTRNPADNRHDLKTLRSLLPYLWAFRSRVVLALSALVLSKAAIVAVPLALKEIAPRAMRRVKFLKLVAMTPADYAAFSTTIFFPAFLPSNSGEIFLGGRAIRSSCNVQTLTTLLL